jgi:WD40 repeat protein
VSVLAGAGVRILLIGTSTHKPGSQLPDLPAVADTVTDLAATLIERADARPDQVHTLVDPADRRVLAGAVADAAQAAEDVLLLCYVGHGLLGRNGELHLATRDTDHLTDGLGFKALSYAAVREELAQCRARSVIVLLDCCFSGRANGSPLHLDSDVFASPQPRGGYLLTSAAPEEVALAPQGERYTAFTGELIRLLRNGDPAGPAGLTLDHIYRYLERLLPEQGRPRPHRQAADRAGELVLAPNPAYRPPLLTLRRTTDEPAPDADAVCPYRGLAAYHVEDTQYFFGREQLTGQLVSRLAGQLPNADPLVVVGPSGSGKSSLLRAGLIPALDAGLPGVPGSRSWPRLVLTPGVHPLAALAGRLAGPAGEPADDLRARLVADPTELTEVAHEVSRRHARGADAADRRLVLVVDQFEEVFTVCEDARERRAFIDALCTATESAALVVLGLRADFYSQCAAEPRLVEALQHHQVIVTPMTHDELRTAIERPAEQAGLALETGLADRMLRDLRASDDAEPGSGNSGLPLLSHALLATWQQREGAVLTLAGYEATGGIWEAVTQTADELYAGLTEPEQETARLLLLRMVRLGEGGVEDTRRRVRLTELKADAVAKVLTAFADARLVTIGTDTAEIAHEALLRAWPRLRRWIDADRARLLTGQQLAEAAEAWDREGRDPGVLYRGARLEAARQWADDARSVPGALATSFLTASIAAARRRTRRGRALVATLTVLLLLAITGGVIAVWQRSDALQRSALILSRQIAAEADSVRSTDPSLAMQLALAAYRTAPTAEARSSLLVSTHTPYATVVAQHTGRSRDVTVSFDGHTLASWGGDNTLRLTDVTHPAAPRPVAALPADGGGNAVPIAFSPSGPLLAANVRGSIQLWDASDPHHPVAKATVTGQPAIRLAFSPDGRVLAAVGKSGYLHLWEVTDLGHPSAYFTTAIDAQDVYSAAFSPDGKTLATTSFDGAVRLWDLTDPRHPAVMATVVFTDANGRGRAAFGASFSPDGHLLAVAGSAGLSVWDVTDPRHPTSKKQIDQPVGDDAYLSTTFSSDGRIIAGSTNNGPITLWSVASLGKDPVVPEKIATFPHRDAVVSITFTPDGTLVAGGGDGVVRDWHLSADLRSASVGRSPGGTLSQFSPDGRILTTLTGEAESQMVRLWDVTDPHHPVEGVALPEPTVGGGFLPTGRTLVTFDRDHMATRLWEVTDAHHVTQQAVLAEPYDPQPLNEEYLVFVAQSADLSPDHRILAVGSPGKSIVRLWDITNPGHPVIVATLPTGRARGVWFSAHGYSLYVLNQVPDKDAYRPQVWDVTDPRQPVAVFTFPEPFEGLGSEGRLLITKERINDLLRLWDMTDPTHPAAINTIEGEATAFTLNTASHLLVVATNGRITLFDVTDPRNLTIESVISTAGGAASLDLSPDGRTLVASFSGESGLSGTLELWSVADPGKPQRLASVSDVTAFFAYPQVFSPDSRTLATTTGDSANVRLLDLDIDRLTRYFCSTGTTITRDQWEQHIPELPYQPPCG